MLVRNTSFLLGANPSEYFRSPALRILDMSIAQRLSPFAGLTLDIS